jgi:hypothetical protein
MTGVSKMLIDSVIFLWMCSMSQNRTRTKSRMMISTKVWTKTKMKMRNSVQMIRMRKMRKLMLMAHLRPRGSEEQQAAVGAMGANQANDGDCYVK